MSIYDNILEKLSVDDIDNWSAKNDVVSNKFQFIESIDSESAF
jgi:hypothetical protein